MSGELASGAFNLLRRTIFSLERRLIGALLLIALCIGAVQVRSHFQSLELLESGQMLVKASSNTEHARRINELASDFRVAANRRLAAGPEATSEQEALTDIAIEIGEQINTMRLGGMPLYQIDEQMAPIDNLYEHVANISEIAKRGQLTASERVTIDADNERLSALATLIYSSAEKIESDQLRAMSKAAVELNLFVIIAGLITAALIALILYDLLGNILPSLRRMHHSIKRLSEGDLEVEVEDVSLRELRALAGPLETFRRNALSVKNLAFTDSATGLPNRRAIVELVAKNLACLQAGDDTRLMLMLVDIDRFKQVNDEHGHAAGDRLVKLVSERMVAHCGSEAMVARLGGDEFALFIPLPDKRDPAAVASSLVAAMREPFAMSSHSIAITVSAGFLELKPDDGEHDVNLLLDRGDLALYAAKNEGRNRALQFTPDLEAVREIERALERDLSQASFDDQLRMVYQPIHAVHDDSCEVEALVRWQHPRLGDISPSRFIPLAERSGLMVQLGGWIIERALADLSKWDGVLLSINLSPVQLQKDGFCGDLIGACRRHGIAASRVVLEVTESLSIERDERALLTLELLRAAGFRIALDDFGAGYSSLSLMKNFRFDRLKIDRSLIDDLECDATAKAVFEAAVTMALRVGAQVVAEGISEADLVAPVSLMGCTHLQGFHFSRPIEANAVEAYFQALRVVQGIGELREARQNRTA